MTTSSFWARMIVVFIRRVSLFLVIFLMLFWVTSKDCVNASTTVNYLIQMGADDSTLNGAVFTNNDTQVKMGKDVTNVVSNFLRFVNVAIPQESVIVSANLSFSGITESIQKTHFKIHFSL